MTGIAKGTPCVRCGEPSVGKGLCHEHFKESRRIPGAKVTQRTRNVDGSPRICHWPRCEKAVHCGGFCNAHYQANRNGGYVTYPECGIEGCTRPSRSAASGMCKPHNQQAWRYSIHPDRLRSMYADYRCGNIGCRAASDLHIDHDHRCCTRETYGTSHKVSCGECVRGWLCRGCNLALGYTQESPERIRGLLDYLERTTKRG